MKTFKTWKLTFTAELVSTGHINPAMLHELIETALRSEAGAIGYLVGESHMELNQTGDGDERTVL
jgi:hypothetical protein